MNRWLGGVLVCWLLHAVHGEPLPVCFTKPQHQQHFNGRWLPLKPTETVRLSPVRVCGFRWVLTVVAWAGTVHSSTNRAATRTGCCSIGSRPEGGQGGTATTQGLHRLRGGLGGGRALPRACACHLSSHTDSGPSFILSYRQRSFESPCSHAGRAGCQTWDKCLLYEQHCRLPNVIACARQCDVHHPNSLQEAERAKLKPQDAHTPVDQRFVPNDCTLGPFDAKALLGSIGVGNTMWFVGDSVTVQSFLATGCLLEASGHPAR